MMHNVIMYIWQLPQNIMGLIIYLINIKSVRRQYNLFTDFGYYMVKHINDKGISLGKYIYLDCDKIVTLDILNHEHGHQIQSMYLGPLYLIIIGLPSLIGNILHRFIKFDYYKQPWEAWADKLGKVKRS